jgi:hypothetical protein
MRETALEGMRRQARWIVRISVLLLAPGLLTLCVGALSMFHETALTRWCAEWNFLLIMVGATGVAAAQLWARWFAFRCSTCRFRLSRAGAGATIFLFPEPVIRFCPHCGANLADTRGPYA